MKASAVVNESMRLPASRNASCTPSWKACWPGSMSIASDMVCVAAGTSKVGMDFVKEGKLAAITYQSAEGDGALPMKLAGDFLCGKAVEKPVYYLRKTLIVKENVEGFLPAAW